MLERTELAGAVTDRLFFAQVREDPRLELAVLKGHWHGPVAVVSSGGCTALSLVAEGAEEVIGVDLNRSQNNLVELKAAALNWLGPSGALELLGGAPASVADRFQAYGLVRHDLTPTARAYWDRRRNEIAAGVLQAGVTERLMRLIAAAVRHLVHPPARISRLLRAQSVERQREIFREEWDTWRWRLLFEVLCNRLVLRRAYDPAFFAHVENPSFARHFRAIAEHTLTELPVEENYFLHHLLTGRYGPVLPPYLAPGAHVGGRLSLVDGGFVDFLRTREDESIAAFALSNICEWLTAGQIDDLFAEIVRTARPGARLVFRNFVGWTEVPERWRDAVREDRALGEELIRSDRGLCQRRIAVCDIRKPGA